MAVVYHRLVCDRCRCLCSCLAPPPPPPLLSLLLPPPRLLPPPHLLLLLLTPRGRPPPPSTPPRRRAVAQKAYEGGFATELPKPHSLYDRARSMMYNPQYRRYR